MGILEQIFGNFVVQVMTGVGIMILFVGIAGRIRTGSRTRDTKSLKELEMKVLSESQQQIAKLRDEMADLKSTLVEHSMSLDRNVEQLSRRVESLERTAQTLRD